ncbi:MAG: TonB-dependent receptor plug domain-containing protein [Rhizomicrobium sp.]
MPVRGVLAAGVTAIVGVLAAWPAAAQQLLASADLSKLSIEQLENVEITSVSKRPEPLGVAPAAVYVITHDEIVRSGALTIPEILRLAPNLFVAQTSPSSYIITARGFSGNNAAQNFSDKLLVLIDGRSVYNPLFSGMYWDMQDVPVEDIERIEVISGPGATLWGANAVNGVINIVTRKSSDTQGGVLEVGAGNQYARAMLQYGGTLGDNVSYRVYAKTFRYGAFDVAGTHDSAHDGWQKPQGGFRLDWTPGSDQVTVSGDIYDGRENNNGTMDGLIAGGNLLGNWQHKFEDGSNLQVTAYYDNVQRKTVGDSAGFTIDTYQFEAQYNFHWGEWNNIVVGAGQRLNRYRIADRIGPVTSLLFVPNHGELDLTNVFVQDDMALADDFTLTLGLKLEDDPYSGVTPMPSVRASWQVDDDNTIWAAASRAIRSPTPFDTHVEEDLGPTAFLVGNPDFRPEKLTAYELGYRGQLSENASLSVSAYESVYDDLKSIELDPVTAFPLHWGNGMKGHVYGIEAWGSYEAADWWKLSAGVNFLSEKMKFKPGASGILGDSQQGDDPHHQAFLRSSMLLSDSVTFDLDCRYVGQLPKPHVPGYVELNSRLGWMVTDRLELSLSGFNLLHAHHREFTVPLADDVKRSFFIDARWKF